MNPQTPPSAEAIGAAAALLHAIRRGEQPRPAAFPPSIRLRDLLDAYEVQQQMFRQLHWSVGGWKASMPDATSGFSAPIAAETLLPSPTALTQSSAPTQDTQRFGIEPEIVFRLGRDLPPLPRGTSYTRETVLEAIDTAMAGIEICVCRFENFEAAPLLDRLADGLMNEALVLGTAQPAWRALDLPHLALRVRVDGEPAHEGVGGHPICDPVIPLAWMANHLSVRGIGLRNGEVITTGSCNGIRWLMPGQRVEVEFDGLGSAAISF